MNSQYSAQKAETQPLGDQAWEKEDYTHNSWVNS